MAVALPAHATTATPRVTASINEVASGAHTHLKAKQGIVRGVSTNFAVIGTKPAANGVMVDLTESSGGQVGFESSFTFGAAGGQALKVGDYKVATPHGDNGTAVLDQSWNGSSVCPGVQGGNFKVSSLKFAGDGHISAFAATFTITCNARILWKGKLSYKEMP